MGACAAGVQASLSCHSERSGNDAESKNLSGGW